MEKGDKIIVWDGFNQRVRADQSTVGTLTQNCGADLKRNGQGIIEIAQMKSYENKNFLVGGMQKNQAVKTDGICTTLTSSMGSGGGYVPMHNYTENLRIRKLTPKECWRLMGFDDTDFEKAEAVNSNTQLYKQAGNSIVVPVVEYIINSLLECGAI